jgi:PilZ domain-containing protein
MTTAEVQVQDSAAALVAEPERREAQRHLIVQRCLVRPAGCGPARPDDWHAIAHNISANGIGLTLGFPLQPGAELIVEPWNVPGAKALRVRVVRSVVVEFSWFLGCTFLEPLDEAELRLWLRHRTRT